jgi:hypothetical protein
LRRRSVREREIVGYRRGRERAGSNQEIVCEGRELTG